MFLNATEMRVVFCQSCSISMKTTKNCLFIDTNIDMYVPYGKSVDILVEFTSPFCPRLEKKTMEHNRRSQSPS